MNALIPFVVFASALTASIWAIVITITPRLDYIATLLSSDRRGTDAPSSIFPARRDARPIPSAPTLRVRSKLRAVA